MLCITARMSLPVTAASFTAATHTRSGTAAAHAGTALGGSANERIAC